MGFAEGLGLGMVAGLLLAAALLAVLRLRRWSPSGSALIVYTGGGETEVSFSDRWVFPIVGRVEEMDISLKTIEVTRAGAEGLICKDNVRVDACCTFTLRVSPTPEEVLKVAQAVGVRRAGDVTVLSELFTARFAEAMKYVAKQLTFTELFEQRMTFRDALVGIIGRDLGGFVLEAVALDHLEQTPISQLDQANILDAQGILQVTRLTAAAGQARMEIEREQERAVAKHRRDMDALRR